MLVRVTFATYLRPFEPLEHGKSERYSRSSVASGRIKPNRAGCGSARALSLNLGPNGISIPHQGYPCYRVDVQVCIHLARMTDVTLNPYEPSSSKSRRLPSKLGSVVPTPYGVHTGHQSLPLISFSFYPSSPNYFLPSTASKGARFPLAGRRSSSISPCRWPHFLAATPE